MLLVMSQGLYIQGVLGKISLADASASSVFWKPWSFRTDGLHQLNVVRSICLCNELEHLIPALAVSWLTHSHSHSLCFTGVQWGSTSRWFHDSLYLKYVYLQKYNIRPKEIGQLLSKYKREHQYVRFYMLCLRVTLCTPISVFCKIEFSIPAFMS